MTDAARESPWPPGFFRRVLDARLPVIRLLLASLVLDAALPAHAAHGLAWQITPVGTTNPGPPRIGKPGYVAPVAIDVPQPSEVPCDPEEIVGDYEFFLDEHGVIDELTALQEPIDGTACQRRFILPVIARWRFRPATYHGEPVGVYIVVYVSAR